MPVLMIPTTSLLPGNRVRATTAPTDIPKTRLMSVALPEIFSDRRVIPSTSGSRLTRSQKAYIIPSRIRSIYFPRSSTFLPASGKKSGEPNLSTPKVLMVSWVSFETMKAPKALAPVMFTFGHLAGFTSIT